MLKEEETEEWAKEVYKEDPEKVEGRVVCVAEGGGEGVEVGEGEGEGEGDGVAEY